MHKILIDFLFKNKNRLIIFFLIIFSIILRLSLFNFESGDYLLSLNPWVNIIKNNGYFYSLKDQFSNYNPPYLYILVLLSYLPISSLYSIKLVSIIFDYILAFFVMLLVKEKYKNNLIYWSSFIAVLFTPTVILNGALWAQCDAIYASGVIAMLYFLIKKKWGRALVSFSLAFVFKLQAIFLFPLVIIYYLKEKRIRKFFILVPLTYLFLILPNYFLGRPLKDLLTIYWNLQVNDTYGFFRLTLNAANLYNWIPNDLAYFFIPAGLIFTLTALYFFILFVINHVRSLNKELVIKLSFIFSLVIPFILPKMHERYFFLADVISIIYAFYFPRLFYISIILITVSLFSYLPYLFGTTINFPLLALCLLIVILIVLKDFMEG